MRRTMLAMVGLLLSACVGDKREVRVVLGADGALPGTIEQAVQERGPNPAAVPVTLSNAGNCDLAWSLDVVTVDGAAWLTVSPTSGTLAAGANATLQVGFDVVTPVLRPGRYTGTATLTGTCVATNRAAIGSPATVGVNLTVTAVNAALATDKVDIAQDVAPLSGTWTTISDAGLTATPASAAVWTGYEVLTFAVAPGTSGQNIVGAAYDPVTGKVRALPAVGKGPSSASPTVTWTGTHAVALEPSSLGFIGASYDPATNQWAPISSDGGVVQRYEHAAALVGTRVAAWGGKVMGAFGLYEQQTGDLYDPAQGTWRKMSTVGAPSERYDPRLVWTGKELMVLQGLHAPAGGGPAEPVADMGLYDPATDHWRSVSTEGAPPALHGSCIAWTGRRVLIYGGATAQGVASPNDWTYDPATDTWASVNAGDQWTRSGAACGWTGRHLVMWGGTHPSLGVSRHGDAVDGTNLFATPFPISWYANSPTTGANNVSAWTGTHFFVSSPTGTAVLR